MNSILNDIKLQIFGSSHSEFIGGILDGIPPNIQIDFDQINSAIAKRKGGTKGTTTRIEQDEVIWMSGLTNNTTTGLPIAFAVRNTNQNPTDYNFKQTPRAGHADFTQSIKFGNNADLSGGGQASGRMTLILVIAGQIARFVIPSIVATAQIVEIGGQKDYTSILEQAEIEGDSLGGIVECTVSNVPAGLGEPFFDSVESILSHLAFSIPGTKGIEFGVGFFAAKMKGSEYVDAYLDNKGRTFSNNSGGINGGITNGNDVIFRIAFRPTSSFRKNRQSIDINTSKQVEIDIKGRHDTCFVLRTPIIVESIAYLAFADMWLRNKKYSFQNVYN